MYMMTCKENLRGQVDLGLKRHFYLRPRKFSLRS